MAAASPAAAATPPRRRAPPRGRQPRQWTAWAFLAPLVVYLVAFYAYPLYRNLDLSLRDYTVRSFVQGDAPFTGWDNYRTVARRPDLRPGAAQHGVFTLVSHRLPVRHRPGPRGLLPPPLPRWPRTLRALFLVPWLLPLIVSASTWSWMLNSDSGIVNAALQPVRRRPGQLADLTRTGRWLSVTIANIWIGIPFNLVILYSGLQNIPAELYEAAALDGANALAAVLAHHLPAAAPGLGDHPAARPRSTPSRSSTSSGS